MQRDPWGPASAAIALVVGLALSPVAVVALPHLVAAMLWMAGVGR